MYVQRTTLPNWRLCKLWWFPAKVGTRQYITEFIFISASKDIVSGALSRECRNGVWHGIAGDDFCPDEANAQVECPGNMVYRQGSIPV